MTQGSSRIPLVLGNWKMHTSLEDAIALADATVEAAASRPDVEVGILPPALWLVPLSRHLGASSVAMLGAQDVSPAPSGAFTGDIAAEMVAPYARFILAGHSERRHLHGERDELVRAKLDAVYRVGRVPVLAVGETERERSSGRARQIVSRQLGIALEGRPVEELSQLVVAYEPVWAIGTGAAATADDASEMATAIREDLRQLDPEAAERVRILYGGSVNGENAAELFAGGDVDGGLIGGASLRPTDFAAIIAAAPGA
jgi:triosephosphate isomerase (TIM)